MQQNLKKKRPWIIDKEWALKIFKEIVFPMMLKEEWIPVGTIIYKDESELGELDKSAGIDCLLKTPDNNIISLAIRIQDSDENLYDSFTVRAERITGKRTEFLKRTEAIKKNYLYPIKVLQAYVSKKTNRFNSMFMMNQKDLIEYILEGIVGFDYAVKIAPGGNKFFVSFFDQSL